MVEKSFSLQIPAEFQMNYGYGGGSLVIEHPEPAFSGMPPWRFTKVSEAE